MDGEGVRQRCEWQVFVRETMRWWDIFFRFECFFLRLNMYQEMEEREERIHGEKGRKERII